MARGGEGPHLLPDRVHLTALGAGNNASLLIEQARRSLEVAGVADRVHLHHGDGTRGWPQPWMFDRILAAAGAPQLPEKLLRAQLADCGRTVLPVGPMEAQRIMVITRRGEALESRALDAVRFVPLIGEEGWDSG